MANRNALLRQMVNLVKIYQKKIVPGLKSEIKDLKENRIAVIRCRECKHYQESTNPEMNGIKFCYRLMHPTEDRRIGYNFGDDDFCSYGERRNKDDYYRKEN